MTATAEHPTATGAHRPPEANLRQQSAALTVVSSLATGILLLVAALGVGTGMRSDGIRSIAATAAVFGLPLAIGGLARVGKWWGLLAEIGLRYALGTLGLLGVGWVTFAIGGDIDAVASIALILAASSAVVAVGSVIRTGFTSLGSARLTVAVGIILVIGVSLAAVAFWRRWSGPPLQPIWDGLIHLTAVNKMSGGEFSLLLSDLTSAFRLNAYLPSQHLRVAVVEALTGVDGLRIYWGGPFVLLPVAAFGVFELTRRTWDSVIGAVAAAALIPFLQAVVKSPAPLIQMVPASEAAALTPFILGGLISTDDPRAAWRRTVAIAALMLPIHFVHGALLLGLLLAAFAVSSLRNTRIVAMAAAALAAVSAVLYAFAGTLRSRAPGLLFDPAGDYATVTPDAGLAPRMRVIDAYFPGFLVGVAAAVVGVILLVGTTARRLRVAAFAWAVLVAYWIPVITFERIHAFLFVATAIAIAAAVAYAERAINGRVPTTARPLTTPLVAAALLIGLIWASGTLTEPLETMRNRQLTNTDLITTATSIAPYEIEGVARFAADADRSLPGVSDPVGQSTLEAFGGLGTVEGPYQPDWLRENLTLALTAAQVATSRQALKTIQANLDQSYYLMVTGRTYHWAFGGRPEFVWEFRPRLMSFLPSGPVPYDADHLLGTLSATGCVHELTNYGEIVFMRIDCP